MSQIAENKRGKVVEIEEDDVSVGAIVGIGVGLAVATAVVAGVGLVAGVVGWGISKLAKVSGTEATAGETKIVKLVEEKGDCYIYKQVIERKVTKAPWRDDIYSDVFHK